LKGVGAQLFVMTAVIALVAIVFHILISDTLAREYKTIEITKVPN